MTDDERQRQMDFILNQQAQFTADIQKLQEGQAKLQEGQAKLQESQAQLQESQAQLQESQAVLLERQVDASQIVTRLASVTLEGFKQTNAKIDALIDAQMRTENSVTKIAEGQTKLTEGQIKLTEGQTKLTEGQTKLTEAQIKLAEAQAHTDQRLDALIDIVREGRNGKH
jgi:chromosome segregation ATPase